jgi:hypothetical protein
MLVAAVVVVVVVVVVHVVGRLSCRPLGGGRCTHRVLRHVGYFE